VEAEKDPGREKMIGAVVTAMSNYGPIIDVPLAEKIVDQLIEEDGTQDHTVVVDETGWTMRHPITERFAGDLFTCPFVATAARLAAQGAFDKGTHRVFVGDFGIIMWEAVPA
jgi:hypothetical protein